jgi:hypothetical protein
VSIVQGSKQAAAIQHSVGGNVAAEAQRRDGEVQRPFTRPLDKDWIVCDTWAASPFAGHVILGVDDGDSDRAAVEYAFAWAERHHKPLFAVHAAPPDNDGVWVDDEYMEQHVRIVDAGSGAVLASIDTPGKLGQVAWSPDGTRFAFCAIFDAYPTEVIIGELKDGKWTRIGGTKVIRKTRL